MKVRASIRIDITDLAHMHLHLENKKHVCRSRADIITTFIEAWALGTILNDEFNDEAEAHKYLKEQGFDLPDIGEEYGSLYRESGEEDQGAGEAPGITTQSNIPHHGHSP